MNGRHYDSLVMDDMISTAAETICLVCTSPPGDNPIGLCDGHYFQYTVACASGRRMEFKDKYDPENLIGRVSRRQRYMYKPMVDYGWLVP